MAILYINGERMPSPTALRIVRTRTGAKAERALDGTLLTEAGAQKRTLKLEWAALEDRALRRIHEAIGEGAFAIEFPDPTRGGMTSMRAVCEDREDGVRLCAGAWALVEGATITVTEV